MAVKIRLKRLGKIRVPQYRVVIVDSRAKRDGQVIEEIGKYHPKEDPSLIDIKSDRAQHWLSVGAQPSDPVLVLLKVTGDWQKFKGIDGAEGTLRVKEPKRNKLDIFNEALKAADAEPAAEAVTKKSTRKPKAEAPAEEAAAEPAAEVVESAPVEEAAPVVEEAAVEEAAEAAEAPAESAETAEASDES